MCGITGFHPLASPEAVQGMVEQIKHRGPDGYSFHTRIDTEVILHLHARLGPACVELLDGSRSL